MIRHQWQTRVVGRTLWMVLEKPDQSVRLRAMPDGRYLWQFRKIISYADTIEQAVNFVEAGAEFFDEMRRNPYS